MGFRVSSLTQRVEELPSPSSSEERDGDEGRDDGVSHAYDSTAGRWLLRNH